MRSYGLTLAFAGCRMHAGGMSDLYPYTFSGIGQDAYTPWNFSRFPADAIVINLGNYSDEQAQAV